MVVVVSSAPNRFSRHPQQKQSHQSTLLAGTTLGGEHETLNTSSIGCEVGLEQNPNWGRGLRGDGIRGNNPSLSFFSLLIPTIPVLS